MSCDFGVWYPHKRLSNQEAGEVYIGLCDGNTSGVKPHPSIDAFYRELIAKYPEIDTVPDDRIDDHDYCPWSCALDRSPNHVIMNCVWSKADYVRQLVSELGRKHGLAVYDPQSYKVTYPDDPVLSLPSQVLVPKKGRLVVLVFLFVFGVCFILIGIDCKTIAKFPAEYLGYFFVAASILGVAGVNIFHGGPLDKRKDPKN